MNTWQRYDVQWLRTGAQEWKPASLVLLPALLCTLSRYVGSAEFAARAFPSAGRGGELLYLFAATFLLFGLAPAAVVRFAFGESLRDYGLRLGDWKAGLASVAILFPAIAVALLLPASFTSEMRSVYPLDSAALDSVHDYLRLELSRGALFYTAWEFLFRGFMLFGLRRYVGDWLAIAMQTVPSCLWHIGLPASEITSSIAAGMLFGIVALRTRSIVWPFLLHLLIGMGLDMLIAFTS